MRAVSKFSQIGNVFFITRILPLIHGCGSSERHIRESMTFNWASRISMSWTSRVHHSLTSEKVVYGPFIFLYGQALMNFLDLTSTHDSGNRRHI